MKIYILFLIVAVSSIFSELGCARINIPEGYQVIEDGFLIGVIDKKGIPHDVTENHIAVRFRKDPAQRLVRQEFDSIRTVKYRKDESNENLDQVVPISQIEFKDLIHKHIVSRRDSRIVIPPGIDIVVDYYIIGTLNTKITCFSSVTCSYKQITRDGVGIKVHVSGAPYEVLTKQEFKKMIKDYTSPQAQPSVSTRPRLTATQSSKDLESTLAQPSASTQPRLTSTQSARYHRSTLAQPSVSTRSTLPARLTTTQSLKKDRKSDQEQPSASTRPTRPTRPTQPRLNATPADA